MGQYILNGDATKDSCNCYTLTQPINNQAGSVWQSKKINLLDSFDFSFKVFLGCTTTGADGVVFILQPSSTSIGTVGEGLGFEGISSSIGISLDTYTNPDLNDPLYDHISIQANGIVKHGNDLAGPIPASSATNNIKDCQWHTFRIKWDPSTHILSTYFDGVFRLSVQKDIVSDLFNSNPVVFWGFSGSTGGFNNLQKICTPLNPDATTGLVNNTVCIGNSVLFSDSSVSYTTIQNYYWDFGDGSTSTEENPGHLYSQPG
ncbi:MAG: PKD domain-containing protein, partial [Ginsengibacter sp.]